MNKLLSFVLAAVLALGNQEVLNSVLKCDMECLSGIICLFVSVANMNKATRARLAYPVQLHSNMSKYGLFSNINGNEILLDQQ